MEMQLANWQWPEDKIFTFSPLPKDSCSREFPWFLRMTAQIPYISLLREISMATDPWICWLASPEGGRSLNWRAEELPFFLGRRVIFGGRPPAKKKVQISESPLPA